MNTDALIIGAGPAGLMAAQVLGAAGHSVLVADQMPSPARKFLMAGKSGLNLTNAGPDPLSFYTGPVADHVAAFGPEAVQDWARGLGTELFTGSTDRVFPKAMKASPLLRAWLARLDGYGVQLRTRWRWTGDTSFDTPNGPVSVQAGATVLAVGGASWRRLGSDGSWSAHLGQTAPFQPSNVGLAVAWSDHMAPHFGQPLKNVALVVNGTAYRGEVMLSRAGLEGGALYPLTPGFRQGAALALDLKPDLTEDILRTRLGAAKGSATNRLRKLGLGKPQIALIHEVARPLRQDLAPLIKHLPIPHQGPRPMDEAISTAGGLRFDALTPELMLKDLPGTFAAGEMLDWEAPTGGWLITACLATGHAAGHAAHRWLTG